MNPVAQTVRVRLVNSADDIVYFETFGRLVHTFFCFKDDAHGQNIVNFVEFHMLCLHLVPDAVWRFDACLYLVAQSCFVELISDRSCELVEDGSQMLAHTGQLFFDAMVFLRVFIAETEVLQFFLDFVQAKTVRQRSVDVERFASYLILFARKLAAQGSHIVQTVGNFDEDDAYVVAHGEQKFFEGFCLCRCFVAEDSARDFRQSVHNLCYLLTKDIGDVLHRIVRIFHHIMQQRGTYAGAAQSYLFASYLCYSYGMHDIGLAGESAHAFMSLPGKVEGLVDDIDVLAVPGSQVGVHQSLVGLVYHPLVFFFPDVHFFHASSSLYYL